MFEETHVNSAPFPKEGDKLESQLEPGVPQAIVVSAGGDYVHIRWLPESEFFHLRCGEELIRWSESYWQVKT